MHVCAQVHVDMHVCEGTHVGVYVGGQGGTHASAGKRATMGVFYFRELSPFETSSLLAETVIRKPRPAGLGASRDLPVSTSPLPSLKSQKMNHHAQLFFLTWILRTDLGLLSHKGKCFTLTHLPSLR